MFRLGISPNRASFLIALSACDNQACFDEGQRLHFCVMLESMDFNVVIGTALLSMYGRCHSLEDAWDVFSKMPNRDIIAWNAMIAAYTQNGYGVEAFQLSHLLYLEGHIPNRATYLTLLDVCGNYGGLTEGKKAHACLQLDNFLSECPVGNALLNMYSRCGSITDARVSFDRMVERDVISWTSIILLHAQHSRGMDALQFMQQMLSEGVLPNQITFISCLSACASIMNVREGIEVHILIVGCGVESLNAIGNSLINTYGKCNCADLAKDVFDRIPDRDVISWNSIIGANPQLSCLFFQQMLMEAYIPNRATFLAVFSIESSLGIARWLHTYCACSGVVTDLIVVTALVSMYGRCGAVEEARALFDASNTHDVILYNALMAALSQNGCTEDALRLLHLMQMRGLMPDKATFVSALDACGDQKAIYEGKQVHVLVKGEKLESDLVIGNTLLTMYAKCGSLEAAWEVFYASVTQDIGSWNAMVLVLEINQAAQHFETMQTEGVVPNKFTFTSLFNAYGNKQAFHEGVRMHARIVGSLYSEDITVSNALIVMYGKCGKILHAKYAFDKISDPDIESWNALIAACARCGQGEEAVLLYQSMQEGSEQPDINALTSILSAFASRSALDEGFLLNLFIVEVGLHSNISIGNALTYMYGKCGSLEDARHVFERMDMHDAISWNALIAVYGQHGRVLMVFDLLHKMLKEGHIPDRVTLVSILTACSHAGLIEEGYHAFAAMSRAYDIGSTEDHYNCMIDLLGRAGQLHELESLIHCMPMGPTGTSWMTLLGACNRHYDLERAEAAADRVMDLHPRECGSFVLLSNMYASASRWDNTLQVREDMSRGFSRGGRTE